MRLVDKAAFGQRLARRRTALGITQTALAKTVGMKQQGIDDIEHGVVARPRLMREIAAALKTTEAWLLWKEGPENAPAEAPSVLQIPLLSWVSAGKLAVAEVPTPVEDVPFLA